MANTNSILNKLKISSEEKKSKNISPESVILTSNSQELKLNEKAINEEVMKQFFPDGSPLNLFP